MSNYGYTVQVTGLSPKATEKDVNDFFAFSGSIEHLEIFGSGDCACTAYVTFKDSYSQETACLLSGATIIDQRVCIIRWGQSEDEYDFWNRPTWNHDDENTSSSANYTERSQFVPSAGKAVTMAQEVVKAMLAKGYVLGKDALATAKALDESHNVSATAAAKVADMSNRIGLTDMFCASVETVRSMDEKYNILQTTKSAVSATGKTAASAADSVMRSSYFSKGALWVSDALNRAAKVASDLGNRGAEH